MFDTDYDEVRANQEEQPIENCYCSRCKEEFELFSDSISNSLCESCYWDTQCEGHPAGPYDEMGKTVYCDGSCRK